MTWSDVGLAGAFIAGTIAGAVAAIRITRIVLDYMKDRGDK